MGIETWEWDGNKSQYWEWEWEGMGIDCIRVGRSGNQKTHSRSSIVKHTHVRVL